ncbi:flavodoxin [Bacillus sp. AFS076308]|uniref:flavodoxin n=1 Tax=unclassified Bacillus (in: firmicutes) TaxID=185979 RepID=UPI000BF775C2|nr:MULTISPECIES: flavodoxin [unclassified Bacillus (in: firmicutes)]PFO08408.1 flavodoxin [Bacillus sp. AFS076308]PGV50715.1 flavodoxin [Bacillus sp. AFS037270]
MDTIIIYASMTGTTELIARSIAEELAKAGNRVTVKDAIETDAEELLSYDRILIGSYTWGDGDPSDEIIGFLDELVNIDLTGKLAAAFGAGDTSYTYFARAVDIIEETLRNQGCEVITKGLKVNRCTEEVIIRICQSFAKLINNSPYPTVFC